MIFRSLSRLVVLIIGVVVLAELVSKDGCKKSSSQDDSGDAKKGADRTGEGEPDAEESGNDSNETDSEE